MSRLSTAVVVDDDARNAKAVAFGFEREELKVSAARNGEDGLTKVGNLKAEILILSLELQGSLDFLKAVRARKDDLAKLPILAHGAKSMRKAAMQAGASEFVIRPVFVKDIVHLARLTLMVKPSGNTWGGDVGDFPGMFYLLRAISSSGRSGVITFTRGLRRGEVRFYEGEVTSAQAGTLHGIAALHQLLLWTEGRFELRAEDVVRRQQIPLTPQELFEDAQRFMNDFEEVARDLAPAAVYEQDLRRVAECVDKIPKEVNPVMRLFDGSRTVADVVEDSPFRVVETVKIAARLIELGALRKISSPRPRGGAHAALAIGEDWMIGTPPAGPVAVSAREVPTPASMPAPAPSVVAKKMPVVEKTEPVAKVPLPGVAPELAPVKAPEKPKKKDKPAPSGVDRSGPIAIAANGVAPVPATPAPAPTPPPAPAPAPALTAEQAATPSDDWTIPTPLASASDLAAFAPVVPSQAASGEIRIPTDDEIDAALATPQGNLASTISAPDSPPLEQVLAAMAGLTVTEPKTNGEIAKAVPAPVAPPAPEPPPPKAATYVAPVPAPSGPVPVQAPPPPEPAVPVHMPKADSGGVARNVKQGGQFSDVEEEFFRQEQSFANAKPAEVESFDDLDEGFEPEQHGPQTFWKRIFGAKPPPAARKATPAPRAHASAKPAGHNKPKGSGGGNSKKRRR